MFGTSLERQSLNISRVLYPVFVRTCLTSPPGSGWRSRNCGGNRSFWERQCASINNCIWGPYSSHVDHPSAWTGYPSPSCYFFWKGGWDGRFRGRWTRRVSGWVKRFYAAWKVAEKAMASVVQVKPRNHSLSLVDWGGSKGGGRGARERGYLGAGKLRH